MHGARLSPSVSSARCSPARRWSRAAASSSSSVPKTPSTPPGGPACASTWVFAHARGEPETALAISGNEVREAVRRAPDGSGCTTLARAEALPVTGEALLRVRGAEGALGELRVLTQATSWRPHGDAARRAAGLLGLGVVLLLAGAWLRRAGAERAPDDHAAKRAALGAGLFLGLLGVLELVPALGGGSVAERGALLLAAQVALALTLGRPALALRAPAANGGAFVALAVIAGLALVVAGPVVAGLFPSTGVAAVETLVALPSGSVAFGLYALVAPLAEELFFRGFLYGAFERRFGANAATATVVALFAMVHLAQTAGAWGAFASVALTGLVLTLLRRVSGSTLVPALAHVAHNAWLTLGALA